MQVIGRKVKDENMSKLTKGFSQLTSIESQLFKIVSVLT